MTNKKKSPNEMEEVQKMMGKLSKYAKIPNDRQICKE